MPVASKMVTNFRRSLSFPNNPSQTTNSSKPRKPALHLRSTSLPCHRSHPIISQLREQISDLNSWSSSSDRTSANWLCDGLRRLKTLHESLDDLLHLPQTRQSLRAVADVIIEKLMEDFLRFVDVYGMFQTLVMRLKEEYSAAQIAVRMRRGDHNNNNNDAKLFFAVHLKNLHKTAKEIGKLVSNFGSIGKLVCPSSTAVPYDEEAELIEVINEVLKMTVSVSGLLFGGLSTSSEFRKPASCMPYLYLSLGRKTKNAKKLVEGGIRELNFEINYLRKKLGEEDHQVKMMSKKMHEMEDCIVEIDGCGERAFRSLINTRVSLLNVYVVTQ